MSSDQADKLDEDVAIKLNGVSKYYQIYDRPHHRFLQGLYRGRKQFYKEFWALKDISFEVKKGETVGIIGRNGSGKSTLLQIICGILTPSAGNVQTSGRVAALLELGSGFNPEFTGRENVYMNAALLGLSKEEVDERFDDIAAFADIGEFIEQPVKTYSSGMYVRLAFAVIAHVDADILVIDEALAVGDVFFTQKCMRFLRKFMRKGTVLFVSHNTGSIINLCKRTIWLNNGIISFTGSTKKTVEAYTQHIFQKSYGETIHLTTIDASEKKSSMNKEDGTFEANAMNNSTTNTSSQLMNSSRWESGKAKILSAQLFDNNGEVVTLLQGGETVKLIIIAIANERIYSPIIGWFTKDHLGQSLFGEHTYTYVDEPLLVNSEDRIRSIFQFKMPMLPNGDYSITVSIAEGTPNDNTQHQWVHDALLFKISSEMLRYGLVGIPFNNVSMNIIKKGM